MAHFITFTENSGEPDAREKFVNAEHTVEATFMQQSGDLQISVVSRGDRVAYTLHGQEAADAVKVLRKLSGWRLP